MIQFVLCLKNVSIVYDNVLNPSIKTTNPTGLLHDAENTRGTYRLLLLHLWFWQSLCLGGLVKSRLLRGLAFDLAFALPRLHLLIVESEILL